MFSLTITNYREALAISRTADRGAFTHAVQLLAEGEVESFPDLGTSRLRLTCCDTEMDGVAGAPTVADVRRLIEFGQSLTDNDRVVAHCFSGRSPSTAAALVLVARFLGRGFEPAAASIVRELQREADPNRRIVDLADGLMHREGRLVRAALGLKSARQRERDALVGGGWLVG